MCIKSIWNLEVPKKRLVELIEKLDADEDDYISFAEVKDFLERYAKAVKRSMRYSRK